jgi:diguanylate cyclase (GGDEF)-like protein
MVTAHDPVSSMVLIAALQEMGFTTEVAEDDAAALDSAHREMPDLILLDVQVPHLNWFETCAAIREMSGGEDVPILIATGWDDLPGIERAFESGATDFVTKPIDAALLQKRLRFQMRASGAFRRVNHALAELQASRRRLDRSQQLARLGDWEWNLETDRLILSAQASEIMDCTSNPPSSSLEFFARCVHPDDRDTASKSLQKVHETSERVQFEHRVLDGERVVHHFLEADESIPGEGRTAVGTVQDITDRNRAEEQIRQLAFYDSLTGLPNRRLLEDHLGKALDWASHSGTHVGLLFVDLDRFKRVNDTFGHMAGDQVLRRVAERLLSSVRFSDSLARVPRSVAPQTSVSRFGGDEFAVVLSGLRDGQDAGRVAQRLLGALRRPFIVQQREVTLGASIGISICPNDGTDSASLLRKADIAMHHAKERGRNNHQFFSASMNEAALRAMEIERTLTEALEQNRLVLHYQPLLHTDSGEIIRAEALVRIREPSGELAYPREFISIAEESGLIISLDTWVLRAACRQLAIWHAAGWKWGRISVNISAQELRQSGFLELVGEALNQAGLEPRFLEIEIRESILLDERGLEALEELHRMGISIAIDDFGTGSSSLSRLSRARVDVLKIDRSFVSDIGSGGSAIVSAIIAMARELGCSVVAEGVETDEELTFLREHGCDTLQGFRCGRPVPAEEFSWRGSRS